MARKKDPLIAFMMSLGVCATNRPCYTSVADTGTHVLTQSRKEIMSKDQQSFIIEIFFITLIIIYAVNQLL